MVDSHLSYEKCKVAVPQGSITMSRVKAEPVFFKVTQPIRKLCHETELALFKPHKSPHRTNAVNNAILTTLKNRINNKHSIQLTESFYCSLEMIFYNPQLPMERYSKRESFLLQHKTSSAPITFS